MTPRARKLSSYFLPAFLLIPFLAAGNAFSQSASAAAAPPYKNAALPIPDRVVDLLSRMTLEEKVDQLNWGWLQKVDVVDPTNAYTAESARKALAAEWGGDIQLTPSNAAILRNA